MYVTHEREVTTMMELTLAFVGLVVGLIVGAFIHADVMILYGIVGCAVLGIIGFGIDVIRDYLE